MFASMAEVSALRILASVGPAIVIGALVAVIFPAPAENACQQRIFPRGPILVLAPVSLPLVK